MRRILFSLIALFCTQQAFSQIQTYQISDFARPDLHREQLGIDVRFNAANFKSDYFFTDKYTSYDIGTSAALTNAWFTNSEKKQSNGGYVTSFDIGYDKLDVENQESNSEFLFTPSAYLYRENRYFSKPKSFIDIDYTLSGNFTHRREKTQDISTTSNSLGTSIGLDVYKGKGRTEIVTDAWLAVTMLEMLQEQSLLQKSDMSHEDITNLANKISTVKNKRFTEFRYFEINEYEEMVQYLDAEGIVDTKDFKFFASFNDIWEYESFVNRVHGKTLKYGLETDNSTSNIFVSNTETTLRSQLVAEVVYENYNSKSSDFQFDQEYSVGFGSSWNDLLNNFTDDDQNFFTRARAQASIGYYPNRRSNYEVYLNTNYIHRFDSNATSQLGANIGGSYSLYISPQLRWTFDGNFSIGSNTYQNLDNGFFSSNNIRLRTIYNFY